MQTLWQDLRYAARTFMKAPAFTLIAVLSIALGIAANTSIFTMVNALLFKPMPVPHPEQLVALYTTDPNSRYPGQFSYPDYRDYRDNNEVFSELFLHYGTPVSMKNSNDKAELIWGELVSGNYFSGLGVTPAAGRVLSPDDDRVEGAHTVAVVSHEFWRGRFGSDPNIVGKSVRLNGHDFTVIGIARHGFSGTRFAGFIPDVWMPIAMHSQIVVGVAKDGKYFLLGEPPTEYMFVPHLQNYDGKMTLVARTAGPPENVAEAMRQEVANIDSELPVYGVRTMPVFLDRILSGPKSLAGLATTFGVIALLMAAIGLYGVMSYSVAQRTREVGVRMALGARKDDVLKLVLKEGLILAGAGIGIGLVSAALISRLLESFLYGISATDAMTFVTIPFILALVALLAS